MSKTSIMSGRGRRAVAVLLAAALFASGCVSKYGTQTVRTQYYKDCYAPISQMRKDESAKTSNTVAAALLGAAIGAAIGYKQDGGRGAIVGAAAGAFIVGSAAYLVTDNIQKKDQAERFAAYSESLDQDIRGLSNAVAAAKLVNKCYENAYTTLKADYQANRIEQSEMYARLNELRSGTRDANVVLAKFSDKIEQNQAVYQDIRKAEIDRGTSNARLNVLTEKQRETETQQAELKSEIQRMKTIAATMDSDYQTIHAFIPDTHLASAATDLCRPAKS